jgi:putative membrane protein
MTRIFTVMTLLAWALLAHAATSADTDFLRRARQTNHAELALGQLALQRAGSDEVKQMARKMVDRHTELEAQLAALARARGVADPPVSSPEDQATYDRLAGLSGAEFDGAFKKVVGDIHTQELAMHRAELKDGSDAELKAFAQGRVTALEQAAPPKPAQRGW